MAFKIKSNICSFTFFNWISERDKRKAFLEQVHFAHLDVCNRVQCKALILRSYTSSHS